METVNMEEEILKTVEMPWERAGALKEKTGRKIIGFFPVYAPLEIIHACGALPLPLFGGGNRIEIVAADSRFASFICSVSKSTLELALQNRLASFDGVVFSNICDVARNLSSIVRRNLPDKYIEYLHLPQNDNVEAARAYYVSEIRRFMEHLCALTGHRPSEDDIRESIGIYNKIRELTGRLYDLKRSNLDKVSTYEITRAVRYSYSIPPEEAITFLEGLVREIPGRKGIARDRVRIVVEGAFCEQPPLELIRSIEEAGCWILDDDFARGLKWFLSPVRPEGDPVENLANAYITSSASSSVRHDYKNRREDALVKRVRKVDADGVLFCIAKFCEPALFDYVRFKERLEKEGIPHLQVEYEEKMWVHDRIKNEIETFVESILFW